MKKFYSLQTSALLLFALVFLSASYNNAYCQNVTISPVSNGTGNAPDAGNIGLGSENAIITVFMISGANSTLNSLTATTAGTYLPGDITTNGFKLWRASANMFDPGSVQFASLVTQAAVVASGSSLTFTGLSESINEFDGSMFYITADISSSATPGRTIYLNAIPSSNFSFTPANVNVSTLAASSVQTILPLINIYSYNENASNVSAGSAGVVLYSFQLDPQDNDPVLNSLTVPTYGSYQLSDIGAGAFKLWYDSDEGDQVLLSSASAVISGGDLVFSGLSQVLDMDGYHQFSITVDLSTSAATGASIGIDAFTYAGFTFDQSYGLQGSNPLPQGSLSTVEVPTVTINSTGPAAGTISPGSLNNPLYVFKVLSANSGAAFTQVTLTTSGTYQASDITSFKLYGGDEDGIEILMAAITPVASGGDLVFNLANIVVPEGEEVYAYLTADISATAVAGRTITIQAPVTSDISIVSGTVTVTASAGGTQTITVPAVAFSPAGPSAGTAGPGTLVNLHTAQVIVSGASATFGGASFTINGTYQASDISSEGFYLVYHKTANVHDDINSDDESLIYVISTTTTVPTSGGTLTFPIVAPNFEELGDPTIPLGTGYISVVAELSPAAVNGRTIQVNSAGTAAYTLASGTKSGTTGNGGTQTIGIPSIAISSVSTPASNVSPGSNQQIYAARIDVTNANAILENLSVTLAGTHQNSDIYSFTLYLSDDNTLDLVGEDNDNTIAFESYNGSTLTFDDLDFTEFPAGTSRYLFIVATFNSNATAGRTINVTATPSAAFGFISGSITGTFPLAAGGIQTVATPVISLTFPTVTGGDLSLNSDNNVLYRFNVTATNANAVLGVVQVTTGGDYLISDLKDEGFKLWFNTSNTIAGSLLLSETEVEANGSTFYMYANNVSIPVGTTGYFFITADISATATLARMISIETISPSFQAASASGTPTTGPDFTITGTTSIRKKSVNEAVIFPNPSSTNDQVKITSATNSNKIVTLYTSTGILMKSYEMYGANLELETLEKGMYLITIQNLNTNQMETQKLIVE